MNIEETRQVAQDGGRGLHLRRLGTGRPVVLLHESPRSSAVLLPLAARLADRFTVFALDTPGYGSSDPLTMRRPEITDFADAIARSMRALGLAHVPVYGTHTGATIAAELGRRHPDLVAGLVLDGYPVFTVEERDLHHTFYLKNFPPRWDGGHVVELWSRIRDQFDFFPWYLRSEAARLPLPKADLTRHRAVLHDFLLSGTHYGTAYAASFRFDAHEALRGQRIPIRIVARPSDLLFHQMQRLGDLPPDCTVAEVSAEPDRWAAAIGELLAAMPGDRQAPPAADAVSFTPDGGLGIVSGRMLVRGYADGNSAEAPPLLLLHDSPGCAAALADLASGLSRDRRVLVPELPGHGRSADAAPGNGAVDICGLLEALVAKVGAQPAKVIGFGEGGTLARLLARLAPSSVQRVLHVPGPGDALLADAASWLPARMDGADLVERWYAVRNGALTMPGGERRPLGIGTDVAALHRRFAASILAAGRDIASAKAIRLALAAGSDDIRQASPVTIEEAASPSEATLRAWLAPVEHDPPAE